jgi:hypothetical protein
MRQYLNIRRVRRNATLGKVLLWAGLAIMAIGLILSLTKSEALNLVLASALIGVITSQIGMTLTNRWGRHPRIDELISASLKGLDDRYALFNYGLGTKHALFGPHGILALVPQIPSGEITFQDATWTQVRPKRGRLSRPRPRSLGSLQSDAQSEASSLGKALHKYLGNDEQYSVMPVLVFVHEQAHLKAKDSPVPALHAKKLKSWLRNLPRGKAPSDEELEALARRAHLQRI